MKRVTVNFRNRNNVCRRCGEKIGDVGDKCYKVTGRRCKVSGYYCIECGDTVQDSPASRLTLNQRLLATKSEPDTPVEQLGDE